MNKCTNVKQNAHKKIVSVLNHGAFIAIVLLSYKYKGKDFHFSNYSLAVLQEFREHVPLEATNVSLIVYVIDLFGDHLIIEKLYPIAEDACFLLWGVSFNPQYKQIPCSSPGAIQNILPPGVIIPPQSVINDISLKCNDKCLCIDNKSN